MTQTEPDLNQIRQLYAQNRDDEAIALCDVYLKDAHHYEVILLKGLSAAKARRFDVAQAALKQAARENKKDIRAVLGLGFMYEGMADMDKAARQFRAALLLDPKNANAHFHLVLCLERLNKLNQAATAVKKGFQEVGEVPGLLYMAGIIHRRKKDYEAALSCLEKISDSVESEYVSNKHFELMQVYDALGRYDEAFAALETAQSHRDAFLRRQGRFEDKGEYLHMIEHYNACARLKTTISF
jgi:tetratricopeptide (TPR) repeat protein